MYIEPNTSIKLLKNVPLDTSYNHTLYFESLSAQSAYFSSLSKHTLANYTYQRVNKGIARVGLSADKCYDCNYMMFQNTSYGSKWFYAFITSVEYINNEVCEIHFEIDVLQSWFFDFTLCQSFIERQHSILDIAGDNTVPENVPLGEYVANEISNHFYTDMRVWVQYTKSNKESVSGGLYGNIYSGLETIMVVDFDTESINMVINELLEDGNDIVNMYMCPESFKGSSDTAKKETYDSGITVGETLDGYTPKNKKLFTYPYNFCNVTSSSGDSCDYLFEYGYSNVFTIYKSSVNTPNAILANNGYRGIAVNEIDTVGLNGFPLCSWSENGYLQYFATQAQADATKSLLALGSTALGSVASGNPLPIVGGVLSVGSKLADVANIKRQPQKIQGNTNTSNLYVNNNIFGFTVMRKSVRKEYAELIDSYFNMYGYATKKVGIPNIKSRPHWNYTKTSGCVIKGSVSADDMKKICSIFDNGITFWKNGNEVGNYDLDNSPL